MRVIVHTWFHALLLIVFIAFPARIVLAAPQALAVLSPDGGVSLTCTEGSCKADLSAFCLQRARPAPEAGTEYVPAAPKRFTLVVTDTSGREHRLPASPHLTFSAQRSFTAVSVQIPQEHLAALGAVAARVEVGANAALLPKAVAGDRFPQTQEEVRYASGSGRVLGARLVDDTPRGTAARILGAMINGLPREGREDGSRYRSMWNAVTHAGGTGRFSDVGLARAQAEFDGCMHAIDTRATYRLRGCLATRHDKIMRDLSVQYWNAGAGS